VDIPRYLVRRQPATRAGRDGWADVLGWPVDQVDAWGAAHHWTAGWLDAPLWLDPPVAPPTGHGSFATDLVSVAVRAPQRPAESTVDSLAARLA
jgi:hypothetical protein